MGILNDVLDFSKIEAGQLMLEFTPFSLSQVLDSISVLVAPNAFNKGVELVYAVAPDVPQVLLGDPMRLEQVLLNLIGNAIKFTERGEVVVTIGKRGDNEGNVVLDFSVRDSGIGIAPEQQAHMFDAFSQGDTSTSRKYGGTGLGLAICRRLVVLMGGQIGVRSMLGQGAEFHFDCSFGLLSAGSEISLPAELELGGRSVLVVDDNASSGAAIARLCERFGWQADQAASGAQALEMLRASSVAQRPYDFLLLDTAMAELDGIAVLTYARADPAISMPRCAMMVAESAREQLDVLAGDLKLDAILSKPVTPDALVNAIVELHTGKPGAGADLAPPPLAGLLHGIYVLLVEDNQINQEVANYILLHAGAAVDIAANGRIAISMLTEAPERYDAVLMDIQMPVMNGYEATAAIRSMGLTDLPIIAMTANAMEEDREYAIEVGMNGHVAKPIDVDILVATLNRVVAGGDAREMRAPVRAGYSLHNTPHGMPAAVPIAGIDLKSTLPRFGGNYANFVVLFKRFESSQGETLDEVRTLLKRGDRQNAIQLVHRLRGVAANLGASELAALAFDFEHALRSAAEGELMIRLGALDRALQQVFDTARTLAQPAVTGAQGPLQDPVQLDAALAELAGFLQNNNLKAMAAFDTLRPALEAALAPATVTALGEAIATLGFASAASQVQDILNRKGAA